MNKAQHKVAASVKVYRVGDMKTRGRKALCGWLRKLANDLQNEPEAYAKTFRARYLYPANPVVRGATESRTSPPRCSASESGWSK